MASKPLADIRPYVLPDVINCPVPVVDHAIASAAIELCKRTHAWRHTPAAVAAVEATTSYAFATPAGAKVERVQAAWLDGKPLKVRNATDLLGVTDWLTKTGTPEYLVVLDDSNWRLYPLGAGSVDMLITLKPTRDATTIDADLFEAHVETIAAGALYRLQEKPGKSWSSPDLAAWNKGQFETGIADAEDREFRHAPVRTARPPLR